MATVMGLVNKN